MCEKAGDREAAGFYVSKDKAPRPEGVITFAQ